MALVGVGSLVPWGCGHPLPCHVLFLLPCLSSHLSVSPSMARPLSSFHLEYVLQSASASSIPISEGESFSSESLGWAPSVGSVFSQLCDLGAVGSSL